MLTRMTSIGVEAMAPPKLETKLDLKIEGAIKLGATGKTVHRAIMLREPTVIFLSLGRKSQATTTT